MPGRPEEAAIERRYPGLIAGLVNHPGIDVVVVGSDRGLVAIGDTGTSFLDEGRVLGDDPLAPYGPLAADGLRRIAGFEAGGDLIVIGHVDPVTNEVVSFEELVGSHGGLGGEQERPFLAAPPDWPRLDPCPVGSPEVHRQLDAWVAALPALVAGDAAGSAQVPGPRSTPMPPPRRRSAARRRHHPQGCRSDPRADRRPADHRPVGLDELGGGRRDRDLRRPGAQDAAIGRLAELLLAERAPAGQQPFDRAARLDDEDVELAVVRDDPAARLDERADPAEVRDEDLRGGRLDRLPVDRDLVADLVDLAALANRAGDIGELPPALVSARAPWRP